MTEIHRYSPQWRDRWDALVRGSRNGLFLFERGYMDYHQDRFEDVSAMVVQGDRLIAAMPASIDRSRGLVTSHGGLTFGGLILPLEARSTIGLDAVNDLLASLREWGGRELQVRLLPSFLERYPSAELGYALWRRGFSLTARQLSTVIPLHSALPINSSRRQAIAKAKNADMQVSEGSLGQFHTLLTSVLDERHATQPVHSYAELQILKERFPQQILLRSALMPNGTTLAGALIYVYPTAWHTQYMASSPEGRATGALDLVIAAAIDEARGAGVDWFSFGTSTTDGGHQLNEGLLFQKESFGGRSVTLDVTRGPL